MDFYTAIAHSQIPAARLRVPLLHLSMDSGYMRIWYKQNQVWQQTRNIQNNSTVALIKLLPLIADLPAPADLASLDYHSNGDLYVGTLVTKHQCLFSVLSPGPWTKPNIIHTTFCYYQISCTQFHLSKVLLPGSSQLISFLWRQSSLFKPHEKKW